MQLSKFNWYLINTDLSCLYVHSNTCNYDYLSVLLEAVSQCLRIAFQIILDIWLTWLLCQICNSVHQQFNDVLQVYSD